MEFVSNILETSESYRNWARRIENHEYFYGHESWIDTHDSYEPVKKIRQNQLIILRTLSFFLNTDWAILLVKCYNHKMPMSIYMVFVILTLHEIWNFIGFGYVLLLIQTFNKSRN